MSILDIFKNKSDFVAGLYINRKGRFQIIELQKINNSYFPIFTQVGVLEDFAQDGIFRKKTFIKKFKELRSHIKSTVFFLNSFENKTLEKEIQSALKIAGFTNTHIVSEPNILGIILPSSTDYQEMSVFFSNGDISFITTEHGKITEKVTMPTSDFKVSTVAEITSKLEQKHIFLSGVSPTMIEPVTGVFYQAGIKVHLQNIWKNFLDFSDGIPPLFPEESQEFIGVLSLTVPFIKKWETLSDEKEPIHIPVKGPSDSVMTLYLPKPKKDKQAILKVDQKIQKIKSNQIKKKKKAMPVITAEKELDYDMKEEKKAFLPKGMKKMFLPKPNKSKRLEKMKEILKSEI